MIRLGCVWVLLAIAICANTASASKAYINEDQVLVIDGKKVFPICYSMPPPIDGKAPNGSNAIAELADAGTTFIRVGPWVRDWNDSALREAKKAMDVAHKYKMHVWANLREYAVLDDKHPEREAVLRKIVTTLKDHPAMGTWKGDDEPAWAGSPIPPLERAYRIVKEIDPHHPVITIHAPRNTMEELRRYNVVSDIVGTDIYPVGYPMGAHSGLPNKTLSCIGDYTKLMVELSEGKKGVWMTLQIIWSGVTKPGRTLRFPTFPEQRFMVYDAIINGTRGLNFFGGTIGSGLTERDKKLGWAWQFWEQVQRRVTEEIGSKSPLHPALVEPDSKLPVKVKVLSDHNQREDNVPSSGLAPLAVVRETTETPEMLAKAIEFCVREVGDEIFVIAAKKTRFATVQVEFSGLPAKAKGGDLLFEEPRKVQLKDGKFTDWFGPYEVHVYRFKKS